MSSFDRWLRRAIQSALVSFRDADLSEANLREANLRWANLSEANLRGANLSGANGLLSAREWLSPHFTFDDAGVIVFKAIGNTSYAAPSAWNIEPGAVLTDVCNPDRGTDCGCGVNFGTEQWVRANYNHSRIWRCRIEWLDLAGTVVPYHTDGKARCERLVLLEDVTGTEEA
jgi:hypothetical protein